MILECSECGTRYLVPDSAIGADGRVVRCANCKHSWFQAAPAALELSDRAEGTRAAAPRPPRAAPAVAESESDRFDAFAHQPPFRPRRNPARRRTITAVAVGIAMLVGVSAMLWGGGPSLAGALGLFGASANAVPLKIEQNPIDRHDLDNGSEIFAVSGRVVNPTDHRQSVPDIRAELRDAEGRIVYSWTITPESRTLDPRHTIEFHSMQLDVPNNSKRLDFSFSAPPVG
ncbi:MJ0042-type zinc finger domain-containing protein [Sphingomonas sp. GlSt437]|uniref:MJ0042-type zinc finger domain-containing protein n=1 Tax=Sphingomonas sp. GlSt437 TaxID=3389970 RepID=UPI003A8B1263